MESTFCHAFNDEQDTLSNFQARHNDDRAVQSFSEFGRCSCRMNDTDGAMDMKAGGPSVCSILRRFRGRFVVENVNISQQMEETPDGWVDGYQKIEIAKRDIIISKIIRVHMMRYCIRKLQVIDPTLDVQVLIRNLCRRGTSNQMEIVNNSFQKFKISNNINYLLRAYTVDSPFYDALRNRVDSFAILIYKNLGALKERAFKGSSYRGLSMAEKDIETYRWAKRGKNRIIEIRTMSSTSVDLEIANGFSNAYTHNFESKTVLCTYEFPVECPTALQLYEIREKGLACISHFPDEKEVLLLPGTLFEVKDVYQTDGAYNIDLINIPVPFNDIQLALREYDEA